MKGMCDCIVCADSLLVFGAGLFADGVKSESGYRSFSPFRNS